MSDFFDSTHPVAPALRLPAKAGAQDERPVGQAGVQSDSLGGAEGGVGARGRLGPGLRRDDGALRDEPSTSSVSPQGERDEDLRDESSTSPASPQGERDGGKMPSPSAPVPRNGSSRTKEIYAMTGSLARDPALGVVPTRLPEQVEQAFNARPRVPRRPSAAAAPNPYFVLSHMMRTRLPTPISGA